MRTMAWERKSGVWVRDTDSPALLAPQPPTSFLRDFDYSLNPLAGCPFSCDDCYVPALPNVRFRREHLPDGASVATAESWGRWVEVRTRSPEVLERALARGALDGARLFLSPVANVYWPGERHYGLTRRLLERLAARPAFDWLLISTRSDLVLRDVDLLRALGEKAEVGISIPTDRGDVKAVFGRENPSIARRVRAATALVAAGIPVRVHVAPLQPHTPAFAKALAEIAPRVWVDWHQHAEAGFPQAYAAHGWRPSTRADAERFAGELRRLMGPGRVGVGQERFADRGLVATR